VYGKATLIGSELGNMRLFTGREFDEEIGLYYNRARYYDADLGRFISRDPIGVADNVDLYSYTANNPVNSVDRSGLSGKLILESQLELAEKINARAKEADSFEIRGTALFSPTSEDTTSIYAHTQIVFYKDGVPFAMI
jgi:RHS repeat-associated protein